MCRKYFVFQYLRWHIVGKMMTNPQDYDFVRMLCSVSKVWCALVFKSFLWENGGKCCTRDYSTGFIVVYVLDNWLVLTIYQILHSAHKINQVLKKLSSTFLDRYCPEIFLKYWSPYLGQGMSQLLVFYNGRSLNMRCHITLTSKGLDKHTHYLTNIGGSQPNLVPGLHIPVKEFYSPWFTCSLSPPPQTWLKWESPFWNGKR